jgi:hypothetical protein
MRYFKTKQDFTNDTDGQGLIRFLILSKSNLIVFQESFFWFRHHVKSGEVVLEFLKSVAVPFDHEKGCRFDVALEGSNIFLSSLISLTHSLKHSN